MSDWKLGTGHGGIIYTIGSGKHYKSGLPDLRTSDLQALKVTFRIKAIIFPHTHSCCVCVLGMAAPFLSQKPGSQLETCISLGFLSNWSLSFSQVLATVLHQASFVPSSSAHPQCLGPTHSRLSLLVSAPVSWVGTWHFLL
jgi:hypothetical protein